MTPYKTKILVVDDEKPILKFLRITFSSMGYLIEEAQMGQEAIHLCQTRKPDLVICDLGLPDMDGNAVIDHIRQFSQVPIIVLSIRSDNTDIIKALDLGADDYLIKPFDTEILLARVRANLRKGIREAGAEPLITIGDIQMDLSAHQVSVKDRPVKLSPKEYTLLRYFLSHAGKMIMHTQLLETLWGHSDENNMQYLRIYISQLRQKIEPDPTNPSYIVTEPGIGYRLSKPQNPQTDRV